MHTTIDFTQQRTIILPRPQAFDYLVPAGTPAGTLVEVTLMGKKLVGMVGAGASPNVPQAKLKPITQLLPYHYRAAFCEWLHFVADYTLADMGSVLALTGCAHANKPPRIPYKAPSYTIQIPELSEEQRAALEGLGANHPSCVTLLEGVTGSGKTEVYFHAIAKALAESPAENLPAESSSPNPQVLVLLPEIALTHQWLMRFEASFGAPPALWHSGQSPAEKKRLWRAIQEGAAQVVVGARSALFLPFANLSLIIVDEEHDASYKQDDGVLYHARDMAVARAKMLNIPVVLASATPSLETLYNVQQGRYAQVHLPSRHGGATMPQVQLVDMRSEPLERGAFIGETLKHTALETLARGEQVLLFLNRRGYAPLVLCRSCGYRFQCPDCSAWMVLHRKSGSGFQVSALSKSPETRNLKPDGSLQCHHCGHHEASPKACPSCGASHEQLAPCGPGVERIAEEVAGWKISAHPPLILSSDAALTPDDFQRAISGEAPLLIGTQMVAKGHHFKHLTLVGVIDADLGLDGADLRVSERAYQLLHQLSGRAGRESKQGTVMLQTYQPEHPVMGALAARHSEFMAQEAALRERGNWPPYGQLAAILLDGPDALAVQQAAQTLARTAPMDARLRVLGPAPAPLSKLKGQYRYRLLVKAQRGIHLQKTLREWLAPFLGLPHEGRAAPFKNVRIKIDVNPYEFM